MDYKTEKVIKLDDQIYDARFHPRSESDVIAVATIAGDVKILKTGAINSTIEKLHKGNAIRKVRFLQNGNMVTIAKTVKVYDMASKQTVTKLKRGEVRSMMYSLRTFDDNIICAGDDDGSVFVWDIRTPDEPVFTSRDCEQYISDIDGKYENKKLIVCTSGEGTLTAYDLRANKMIEPQSELFEAGFQCVKMVEANKKVVIGAEDGAIYVFNQNEWGHTSGKFSIDSDHQNRGKCSVESIELLDDNQTFLAACSDGKVRALTLWPHKVISDRVFCRKSPLESIHVNPDGQKSQVVISGENYINIVNYEYKNAEEDEEDEIEMSDDSSVNSASESISPTEKSAVAAATDTAADDSAKSDHEPPTKEDEKGKKKLKPDQDDYLNVFK